MEMDTGSTETDNGFEFHISSAIKFTYQGLYRLCEILPMREFLKCRLICRRWEMFISCHPRFTRSTTRFVDNIFTITGDSLQVAREREIYWRNVHLDFFPFTTKSGLISYWRICGMYVRTLHLESLNISCLNLISFLNDCPSVTNVTFENNGFRPRFPRNSLRYRKIAIFCSHKQLHKKFFPSHDMTAFTSVTFSSQNVIPLCILRYIKLRTQGKLEKLTFKHATCNSSIRALLEPTKDEVENLLIDVIKGNATSLKTLAIENCRDVANFLNRIAEVEHLNLRELHFDPMRFPSTSREMDASFGLNLLQSQQAKSVTTLKIGFHLPDSARLQEILTNYGTSTLRKLKIVVAKGYNDIRPILSKLENLKELEIKELGLFRRVNDDDNPVRGINPNYLASLPSSLESLTIMHSARGDNITNLLLQNTKTIFLKHLKIDYTDSNDLMCQLIISSFQMLETLQIHNSRFLTDVGVTGICANTCKYLRENRDEDSDDFDFQFEEQFSISILKSLRILSLYGCRNISDISITYGLKLEKLRILDVTESGVLSAVTNNLNLERVILYDIIMPTSSVLDMIAINKKLRKVHLCKDALLKQRENYKTGASQDEVALISDIFTDEPHSL